MINSSRYKNDLSEGRPVAVPWQKVFPWLLGNKPVMYYDPSGNIASENGCGNSGDQNENGTTQAGSVERDVKKQTDKETEVILPNKPHKNKQRGH